MHFSVKICWQQFLLIFLRMNEHTAYRPCSYWWVWPNALWPHPALCCVWPQSAIYWDKQCYGRPTWPTLGREPVTCHMELHSVTCHPTQVNTLRLNPSQTGQYSIYLSRRDGRLSWP